MLSSFERVVAMRYLRPRRQEGKVSLIAGLGLGVAELYSGFVFGAELQQFTVVGLLVAILVWRQIQQSRHRQPVQ